ncbi:MAG: diguanylate cyclase [Microthrixaceae bacterium]
MSSSTVVLACLAAAACLVAIVLWFRLAAERRAFEAQRRAAAVLHRGDDAVLLLDGDGVITFANRAAGVMAGRERSALEGTPITDWILGEDAPMLAAQLGELRSAPPNATESIHGRLNHPTLGERNLEATARNLLEDDEVGAIVLTLRDVTAGWELEEQLGRRAFWDPLTELPNRALFFDRVAHSLSRPDRDDGRGMIVLIDIDDMRGINEGTDMNVGNRVLQAVADRIRVSVPEGDSVARVGGDTLRCSSTPRHPRRTASSWPAGCSG